MLAFTTALRSAGLNVTPDRGRSFVAAVACLSLEHRRDVYWAGRATLCATPDDFAVYTRTFESWFAAAMPKAAPQNAVSTTVRAAALTDDAGTRDGEDAPPHQQLASRYERLRHRDIATLDGPDREQLAELFSRLVVTLPTRRGHRKQPDRHGPVDRVRSLREQLRRAGEPGPLRRMRVPRKARRVVWLIDVSGSMTPYADSLLRLAHRVFQTAPQQVEVFTLGTRLTRITPALKLPDADDAIARAGALVPDWSGGTRLGEVLRAFNVRWGQRSVARAAVVIIASDGWERGDAALLGQESERLHHVARRVIWANPHRGKAGYEPVQRGIVAVLPHVDDFVAGHSLASFEKILKVMRSA